MAMFRDEVIAIKSSSIGERDRIYTLFGKRTGKFKAIAKGVKRIESKKSGHLQSLNICKIACAKGKTFDVITEVESSFELGARKLSTQQYELVGYFCFVLDKFLSEGVREYEVYKLAKTYLIGEISEKRTKLAVYKLLEFLGFVGNKQADLSYDKLKILVDKILDRAYT